MKKLITILCVLGLVLAFTLPAAAQDNAIDGINDQNQQSSMDNGALAKEQSNASDNPDSSNVAQGTSTAMDNGALADSDSNASDNPDSSVVAQEESIAVWAEDNSDNSDNSTNLTDSQNNNSDNSTNFSDSQNDNDDNSIHDQSINDSVFLKDSEAVAIGGGFAIAVEIDDIDLAFATTYSDNWIEQSTNFNQNNNGNTHDNNEGNNTDTSGDITQKFQSKYLGVKGKVTDNVGLFGANFTAGNFNNNANLNNVNVSIQY